MIELTDTMFVDTFWFVPGPEMDFTCLMYRERDEDVWHATGRFRYYTPESADPFDQHDRKRGWSGTARLETAVEDLRQTIETGVQRLATEWGTQVQRLDIRGSSAAFMAQLQDQPWAHMRVQAPAPARPQ